MSTFEKDKIYQTEKGLAKYNEQVGDLHLVTVETVSKFGSETCMFYVSNVEEVKEAIPVLKDIILG